MARSIRSTPKVRAPAFSYPKYILDNTINTFDNTISDHYDISIRPTKIILEIDIYEILYYILHM